jgi:energy-coupling factor transporter ATP-binding protein EcfA2
MVRLDSKANTTHTMTLRTIKTATTQAPEPQASGPLPPDNSAVADQLAASLQNLIAQAGLTERQVRAILDQELSKRPLGISEPRVREIATEVASNCVNRIQLLDSKSQPLGDPIVGAHAYLPVALEIVQRGIPLLLFGAKGCGKTTLAEQLATALQLQFAHISCSRAMTAGKLVGFANPHNGSWLKGELTRHLEQPALVLVDEADASDPGVQLCMNSVLANRYIGEPSGLVRCHEKFVIVMATNTVNGATRQYNAREKLDDALLDRMAVFELHMDNAVEASLAGVTEASKLDGSTKRGGLCKAVDWLAEVRTCRTALQAKGLVGSLPSPRAVSYGAQLCGVLGRHWLRELFLYRGASMDVRNVIETELAKGY